ncbi:DUF4393 domain-containing protein [Serratia nevei]|uniref:DUF4393 domain-containing protein n=1 Tax=Serratia nevei TaxID=2703794 RepID=UPI00313D4FBE|nr:hypothetical protein SMKC034_31880 [Serratia marcescens]
MSEENSQTKTSQVTDIVHAVAAVTKEVPIYQDAIQPAAQEVGKALGTVAKLVNVALAPVSALVWGYDQIKEFTATKVARKLENVPPENIITPKPNVAGPAIEALRYTGHEESLSEMYANLLATAMNKDTIENAHPAFVEIIKQLTPDEAKIINLFLDSGVVFPIITMQSEGNGKSAGTNNVYENYSHIGIKAGCDNPHLTPAYLNNLCRLGLCEIPNGQYYFIEEHYNDLLSSDFLNGFKKEIESSGLKFKYDKSYLHITTLGKQFAKACTNK